MLQKAQGIHLFSRPVYRSQRRLNSAMRGLCQWAVLDPGDRVLDMNCGSGELLQALKATGSCQLCGITSSIEKCRQARSVLTDADVLFAFSEDIPWHDDAFDLVLSSQPLPEMYQPAESLREAMRVLKPGGQLLLATPWYPAAFKQLINRLMLAGDQPSYYTKQQIAELLVSVGFDNLTWHMTEPGLAVISCWKPRQLETDE